MFSDNMIIDGTYQIVQEIGSGGMGIIYLAYHLRLEKYVVLKKIKNTYADISMLRNEVDILKSLHHPYLPQVYDFLEYNGDLYTVIDYIDGYDFNYYIANGYVFSEGQLIKWLRQLCEVLWYLHSQPTKILHTDIKPGNIIITTNGDVCLIDFGISLYSTDIIKGLSINYSSPEQYGNVQCIKTGTGEYFPLDERTDIYSLGASFYHIMTGVQPNVTNYELPKIGDYRLGYSEAFINIIAKSLECDPNRRYRNTKEMLAAIDNIKKQDARYKKYLLVQVLSSVTAAIMIVSGVFMIINGYRGGVQEKYTQAYNSFITMANRGDNEGAKNAGTALINSAEYDDYLTNEVKAQILHKIGDCYFADEDYYNAAYFYESAVGQQPTDIYYRDYAFALVANGEADRAREVLEQIKAAYPGSVAIILTEARLCYNSRQYEQAIGLVDSVWGSVSADSDNFYTAGILKGDSYSALHNGQAAAQAYEAAIGCRETAAALRKLGNAYLDSAEATNSQAYNQKACGCFKKLCTDYSATADDVFNYAQSVLLAESIAEYSDCERILNESLEGGRDCRLSLMLALIADAAGDPQTETYLRQAYEDYGSLSDAEKNSVSNDILKDVKTLYKSYCGQDW